MPFTSNKTLVRTILFLMLLLSLISCSRKNYPASVIYSSTSLEEGYANLNYWAAHPWKWDPSDSIPSDLRHQTRDSIADVFFVHPTTYTSQRQGWNAEFSNAALNAKTDNTSILFQASVFNQHCRVFAPRYRQAHLSAFFTNTPEAIASFDTAYADVKKAFEFYLLHHNNGRPIIIAGHSQGAKMADQLLKDFFDGKPLQKQLVVAYTIGWPVPQNYFSQLAVCSSAKQTACFCTWRTYREGYVPEYIQKEEPRSHVTNPLNWQSNSTPAARELNKGSVLQNFNQVIKATAGARVHEGVLWISKPKFPGSVFLNLRNYHIADINLFYVNIRQNVEERIQAFLNKSH